MKNKRLKWLLGEARDERGRRRWTVERIAEEMCTGRAHLTQVLRNKPGRGGKTRRRFVVFLMREYPKTWREIVECLEWSEEKAWGERREESRVGVQTVPGGTFYVEHERPPTK